VARFAQAFPGEVTNASDIEITHVARAIAAYERELVTPDSPYDAFVAGDYEAFNEQEQEGFQIFFGKGLCGPCHGGPMLSDYRMHVIGVGDAYENVDPSFLGKNGEGGDFGRFHADPLAFSDEKYAFRTMTIRMVERTGPYFHSGSARTLRETVEFYDRGGLGPDDLSDAVLQAAGVERSPLVQPLGLTDAEIDAVVAFMKTTTAEVRTGPGGIDLTAVPDRVPSGLVPPGVPTPEGEGPFLLGGPGG
jgi:cytochrome c peroxidase